MEGISFIVLVGSEEIYNRCLKSSPLFAAANPCEYQVLPQSGFATAGLAFNDGIAKAKFDRIICLHQDVILPITWMKRFALRLQELEDLQVPLGVVGCWGITSGGERGGHVYHRDRQVFPRVPGDNGNRGPMTLPVQVQTLDELLISFDRRSGLRFDPLLPNFFGYAVDICLTAEANGRCNFAIDCPCIHDTVDQRRIRTSLAMSASYLLEKWRDILPIQTPSGVLESKWALRRDRVKLAVQDVIGYKPRYIWWEQLPQVDKRDVLFDRRGDGAAVDPA